MKLDGETLHIGCKKFNVLSFFETMTSYLNEENPHMKPMGPDCTSLLGSAKGLRFGFKNSEYHFLPWSDIQKIYDALKEYGVK